MTTRGRPRFTIYPERILGGKLFKRTYHFASKAQAKEYAARMRNLGAKIRIIGHTGSWTVYRAK